MAISKKLRFEVFKRDNFTCQYCGRQTPDVILEVDHIIPKAKGGDDDIQNLIASCFDCNNGKGATPLNIIKTRNDLKEDLLNLAEKELQLREYRKLREKIERRENKDVLEIEGVLKKWSNKPIHLTERGRQSFKRFLKIFPVSRIVEAINMASTQVQNPSDIEDIAKYTYGILHNWRREQNIPW